MIPPNLTEHAPAPQIRNDTQLREAAIQLEARFLAEMLKSAGLSETRSEFGGSTGEDQFSSFLVQEQTLQMARAGGIGLAESIFDALKERGNGN